MMNFKEEVLRIGSLADVLEERAMDKGIAKGMIIGGKIIKLHIQGMKSGDIAASLHLNLESVEAVVAKYENE